MRYDPREGLRPPPLRYNPFNALVAPRPIGWISTIGMNGHVNLAPFSYFNAISADPPMVMFAPNEKNAEGTPKDTLRNVNEIPQFVVNIATWNLREQMNLTSKVLPYGQNEFEVAGLDAAPSERVKPPRVAAAKAALECEVTQIIELPAGRAGRQSHLVLGRVVSVYIDDAIIVDGRIDESRVQHIARLGYHEYAVVREVFDMPRPEGGAD